MLSDVSQIETHVSGHCEMYPKSERDVSIRFEMYRYSIKFKKFCKLENNKDMMKLALNTMRFV